jgi:pimeloyl-ACP methyl ester carboxylesterase
MSTTVIDLLDALRTHLNDFELPPPCSVHLATYSGGPQVSLQLATHHLPEIAAGLLAWGDTLTEITGRVAGVHCCAPAPSEPDLNVG